MSRPSVYDGFPESRRSGAICSIPDKSIADGWYKRYRMRIISTVFDTIDG